MTITVPAPPSDILRDFVDTLRAFVRAGGTVLPEEPVNITQPLPIYVVESQPEASLETAIRAGWRFLILGSETASWVDVADGVMTDVYSGPAADNLIRAGTKLETFADGEAALVIDPLISTGALWIRGTRELLWEYSPELGTTAAAAADLLADWKQRRETVVRGSANAIE
jgi:hypothetical protein